MVKNISSTQGDGKKKRCLKRRFNVTKLWLDSYKVLTNANIEQLSKDKHARAVRAGDVVRFMSAALRSASPVAELRRSRAAPSEEPLWSDAPPGTQCVPSCSSRSCSESWWTQVGTLPAGLSLLICCLIPPKCFDMLNILRELGEDAACLRTRN